ncbi:MAG: type II toxin-antitoxin system RelE/ParE family toxin [Desulfobacteraceae bacterium]|nr:type II toxin-antitoxin system RelE/ParE family toxin [Desulfobacteraceae bacterium]
MRWFNKDWIPFVFKKLCGQERYRLRYGRYRIIYFIQDEALAIWIVKVGHRKNVYC